MQPLRSSSFGHARSLLVIGLASVSQAAAIFLKGVILARVLGPREFGLCVIVLSVTGALDIFADAGIDRFIVQNRFGYRQDVIRTSHCYRVWGSIIVGFAIACLSYPVSIIFHSLQLVLPLALTGGVVVIRGFSDLSYKLQQRDYKFEKETIIDVTRFGADVFAATAVALLTHSFIAVLAGSFANAITQLVLSHCMSSERYSFKPRRSLIKLVGRFSIPIYLNAAVLFAAMQGDRMVVASLFTKTEVALYAVSCTLGQGLAGIIGKISERLLLPVLAKSRNSFLIHRSQVIRLGVLFIIGSVIFQVFICLFAPILIKEIYGPSYTGITILVDAAAIFQMIQIQQSWLNSVLIANGITRPLPRITIVRSAAFPVAIIFVLSGFSLVAVPIAFACGAAASLFVSYNEARKIGVVTRWLEFSSALIIAGSVISVAVFAYRALRAFH